MMVLMIEAATALHTLLVMNVKKQKRKEKGWSRFEIVLQCERFNWKEVWLQNHRGLPEARIL